MNVNKITVIEPLCERFEHTKFNSLFISSLVLASGADAEIEFWGEVEHCTHVAIQLGEDVRSRIRFRPFCLASMIRNRRARVLAFLLTTIIRSLLTARKTVFLSVNTPVIYATTLLRSKGPKRYIIHSYFPHFLSLLETWKKSSFSLLFRNMVLNRCIFISLRGDIVSNATDIWDEARIDHVEHPVGAVLPKQSHASKKTIIGFLGRATQEKGFDLFEVVSEKFQSPSVEFVHIGPDSANSAPQDASPTPSRFQISDAEFEQQMRHLSFVFFANRRESYRYIASGVVFDAIEKSVPIIGIRDTYIEYLEAKHSLVGLFFDTPEALDKGLEALVSSSPHPAVPANRKLLEACAFDAPTYLTRLAAVLEL